MFIYRINESLTLQVLQLHHAKELYTLVQRSAVHLRQWLPWVDTTECVSDIEVFIKASQKQFANNYGFQAGIWHEEELIGVIGFHRINWHDRATCIGYWLAEEYQGNGVMTKACCALIDYALGPLALNRVEIRTAVENKRSRAIPERLGFTQEGCIRDAQWLYDHYVDHVVYSILAKEWPSQGAPHKITPKYEPRYNPQM
ncbi:MAG: GNAT family N-acetyltransferase [Firmicutes bacterium]|nr:GNAT family N-acetyltransferase [Bacillota bacterium]